MELTANQAAAIWWLSGPGSLPFLRFSAAGARPPFKCKRREGKKKTKITRHVGRTARVRNHYSEGVVLSGDIRKIPSWCCIISFLVLERLPVSCTIVSFYFFSSHRAGKTQMFSRTNRRRRPSGHPPPPHPSAPRARSCPCPLCWDGAGGQTEEV